MKIQIDEPALLSGRGLILHGSLVHINALAIDGEERVNCFGEIHFSIQMKAIVDLF